ncbi:hypothetical protein LAZ67_1001652 [Cordylochernes scorpioides]|uniref:Transposase IS30-like HTH domain-containing protein n=1 Tax=Cordylochernes scorpioides TaxID=51811 RepID=A0ABY6JX71_9ARAC|nr:hypothetical protein LAZ67_1001652 [Cordylochernes scorpioides]
MWVLFDNRKRKRQSLDKTEDLKPSLHPKRIMLIVWWSYAGLLHYRFLNSGETMNSEVHCQAFSNTKELYLTNYNFTEMIYQKPCSTQHSKKKWVAAFKLGRISTEDGHGARRPVKSVTQENIEKIHDLVMLDRGMTVRQIEETLGIPKTTVERIMREHLGLRKLSARWVPKPLTPDQKAVRRK